jgi:hypothetical protein
VRHQEKLWKRQVAIWPKPFCFSHSDEVERMLRIKTRRFRGLILNNILNNSILFGEYFPPE